MTRNAFGPFLQLRYAAFPAHDAGWQVAGCRLPSRLPAAPHAQGMPSLELEATVDALPPSAAAGQVDAEAHFAAAPSPWRC